MTKWSGDPGHYCPICGVHLGRDHSGHHCKQAVVNGIDAANSRAWKAHEEERSDKTWHFVFPDYYMRLKRGFQLLNEADS